MAGRYLVTGVQLGMLVGMESLKDRQELVEKIEEGQFINNSSESIHADCEKVRKAQVL